MKEYSLYDFVMDLTVAFGFDRDSFLCKIKCEFFKNKLEN
jgi:hypothetical protein